MIVEMSKGRQITIPAELRNEFELVTGSKLEITKKGSRIILKPIKENLHKMFKKSDKIKPKFNLNAKQMDELNERLFR